MASAQVLRKQEHLEAGKKKLEEFRRKKAAEKAKKTASTLQLHVSKGVLHEKQLSETELVFLPDSNGVGISDDLAEGRSEPSRAFEKNDIQESDIANKSDFSSSGHTNAKLSFLTSNEDGNSSVLVHSYLIGDEHKGGAASVRLDKPESANFKFWSEKDDVSSSQLASGIGNYHSLAHRISSNQEIYHASSRSSDSGLDDYPSTYSNGPEKDLLLGNSGTSAVFTQNHLPETSIRALLQDKFGNYGHQDNGLTSLPNQDPVSSTTMMDNSAFEGRQKSSELSDMVEKKSGGFAAQIGRVDYSPPLTSDHRYTDYKSDVHSSPSHAPLSAPAAGRRSRSSFLDSIHISKGSSSPLLFGAAKADSSTSKVYPMDSLGSLVSQKSVNSFIASGEGVGIFNHVLENKHDFFSQKQNEDFAALEQHIEDLTQEKFSLQRTLESSRALTESLVSENSTLTESFNQQGSIVNQLKFDLEKLQEEIKAQLVELEVVKIEYANAQLECNAADERAKLLASEVIGLEEKALRLRSNELKLERQLENSQAEISSCRKKMSSLEKDWQDLQSTIDALQEEKKLLQPKLRKASESGKSVGVNNTSLNKKDVSTSTEDVDVETIAETSNSDNHGTALLGDDASTSQFQHENVQLSLKSLPLTIPSDQIRKIQNINTLTVELALEKDQLIQALSAESSQRSKLSELNKELTRKLESQTQRLELLMTQTMGNENIQSKQPDPHTMHERISYADEGDEVVERVLGWIMKLFPGGPSRRQISKQL